MANYFSFKGRLSRHPYWMMTLKLGMFTSICFVILLFATMGGLNLENILSLDVENFSLVSFLGTLIFMCGLVINFIAALSITIRRIHDRNLSGLWAVGFPILYVYSLPGPHNSIVLNLILFLLYLFVLGFLKGTPGENRFGPDPLSNPKDIIG